ncbi:MAG: DUF1850 domain-containing protein [Atribacterota bacterium]|nr:DUF1850 domain-containing protein [Atribacterota bacterium]MDD5497670.1 DUF1850 domain-containing protein [Atribacterota bacterium]
MNLYSNKVSQKVREIIVSLTFYFLFIFLLLSTVMDIHPQEAQYYLELIHRDNQNILLSIKVLPKEIFYLEYTNSRDLNPVIDVFQVEENGYFYLLEERFPYYGVGQEYHSSKDIYFEEGMVVVKLNKKINRLPLRVAYTVPQILKIRDEEYLLSHFAEGGEPLDIQIIRRGG